MPENLNRTILLRLALVLIAVVLADKIFLSTGMSPADTESRMQFVRAQLAQSSNIRLRDDISEQLETAEIMMSAPFSRQQYLESLIGQGNIASIETSSPLEIAEWDDHSIVSYRMRLRMPVEELYASLDALDRDGYPLRVERLRLWSTDLQRQTLMVEMIVSTITHNDAISGAVSVANSSSQAPVPTTRRLPDGPIKNIFFPVITAADQPPLAAEVSVRAFTLAGIDLSSQPNRAMLILEPAGDSVWVEVGSSIDDATLLTVSKDRAVFSMGDDEIPLPLGSSSELLMLGKRRFKTSCVIKGIIRYEGQYMALASFAAGEGLVLLGVGDVLPTGRIIAIGEEYITLDNSGREEIVPLGNSTDNPVYHTFPIMGPGVPQ